MIVISDLLVAAISGIIALSGVIVGAKIQSKDSERKERKRRIIDAYADIFKWYYANLIDRDSKENWLMLVSSVERAMLLCSEDSAKVMQRVFVTLSKYPPDVKEMSEVLELLRESAKKEMGDDKRE